MKGFTSPTNRNKFNYTPKNNNKLDEVAMARQFMLGYNIPHSTPSVKVKPKKKKTIKSIRPTVMTPPASKTPKPDMEVYSANPM